ncbi:hypothetical protein AHF37_09818 [Paragonimus kellicotti]|nr:hypothetical protein AHF37_09818 [Paragonimus kellicotti]
MSSDEVTPYAFEVYKKCTADGRVALYLEKRSFYDHLTYVDPIGQLVIRVHDCATMLRYVYHFLPRNVLKFVNQNF